MIHSALILGSSSPRRAEILSYFSVPFVQIPPPFDESLISPQQHPITYATALAAEKGNSLLSAYPNMPIITADTIVYLDGIIYNKPKNKEQARQFLQNLSGRSHTVCTAVALSYQGAQHIRTEETTINFYVLTERQIDAYLDRVPYLDKAGGYAIQQSGYIIVQSITGCYYNVMGLPIHSLQQLLLLAGIDLWDYLPLS